MYYSPSRQIRALKRLFEERAVVATISRRHVLPSLQAHAADAMSLVAWRICRFAAKYTINAGTRRRRAFIIHTFARCFVSISFSLFSLSSFAFSFCPVCLFPHFHFLLSFASFILFSLLFFCSLFPYMLLVNIYLYNNIINKYLLYRLCARICARARVRQRRCEKGTKKERPNSRPKCYPKNQIYSNIKA